MPRIVSFLPAATEIVYALGAGDELVGRSHECDHPADVARLPIVSRPALNLDGLSSASIDSAVTDRLRSGDSLYRVDERLLDDLAPDVVLTQDLCQVCAPSGNELSRALRELKSKPEVLWLTPKSIADIETNILDVARVTGRETEGDALTRDIGARLRRVIDAVADAPARRVVFLEWTDPVFCAGHWVPEMIALAGGRDAFGRAGTDSVRISWDDVVAAKPEIVLVAPCGYGLDQAIELARTVPRLPGVAYYALDANAYFARPGPRVAEGVELLAHVMHPDRVTCTNATSRAFRLE